MNNYNISENKCTLCQGTGFISTKEAEYIWDGEQNLLDAKIKEVLVPCPNCSGGNNKPSGYVS